MSALHHDEEWPVWLGDRLVAPSAACVAHDDHGVTVGDGVFETIWCQEGRTFALTRHLRRLRVSAHALLLPCPSDDELRAAVDAVAGWGPGASGVIRVTLTAGRGPLGSPRGDSPPTLLVATRSATIRTEPTGVASVPFTRNEHGALAGVKSTSYAENVLALRLAADRGASEALFANTSGQLCEGTGSNVFVGFGNDLVTPPLHSGCLAGVTRALLLEAGVGREGDVPMAALADATEMFLVSTTREVQPVAVLDDRTFEAPGPLTQWARGVWLERYGPGTDRDP